MARTAFAFHYLKLLPGVSPGEFTQFFQDELSPALTPKATRVGAVEAHQLLQRSGTEADSAELVWLMVWDGVNTSAADRVSRETFEEHRSEVEKRAVRVSYRHFDLEAAHHPFNSD